MPNIDAQIINSWSKNTTAWTKAVRQGQIASRQLVTNEAIIEAIISCSPSSVLDLGCGEGWLTRSLTAKGIPTIGVDAVADLIAQAQSLQAGDYRVISYEEIANGKLNIQVDAIACNFALFGKQSVENLLATIPDLLNPWGYLIIQTLHPLLSCGDLPYQDGWIDGSWSGFSDEFTDPAPWYFRTLSSWVQLLVNNGWQLLEIREPIHPHTLKPASIIFITQAPVLDQPKIAG